MSGLCISILGWTSDQIGRKYGCFDVCHGLWHLFSFLGLTFLWFTQYSIAKRIKDRGLVLQTLEHTEEAMEELGYKAADFLDSSEEKCGPNCRDIFLALWVGDKWSPR